MAIYHLHAKMLSRANGRNAVESAAYRHACSLFEETLGETFDYSRKKDVLHSEMNIPSSSSEWLIALADMNSKDHTAAAEWLWNHVEQSEKRQDAQVAREIEFSLPVELTAQQNTVLAREFITDQFVNLGMIADWSIHWDEGNPHVHVMLTTRELGESGFGYKVREWNTKALLSQWREKWAEYANFHLRLHHHEIRIDHRSYIEQGIELVPTFHLGRASIEIHKQGYFSERVVDAKHVARENLKRIHDNPDVLFKKITAQTDTFTPDQIGKALGTYADSLDSAQRAPFVESATSVLMQDNTAPPPCLTAEQEAKVFTTIEYHESVFTERDIARALNTEPSISTDLFSHALLQIKTSPLLIPLGAGEDGRDRYTTQRLFDLENRLQTLADDAHARHHSKISNRCFKKALERYQQTHGKTLTDEQRHAVKHITSSQALTCLVGRAGTGKSFSLGAAKQVWEEKGCVVIGVALSGIACAGLEKDASIPSRTIESFRYAVAQTQLTLTPNHVVVMDEAGMTDIESMFAVMLAVIKAKAKLVLVGDPNQLQPVGPGAVFRALLERIGFVEIQTVYRQQVAWQIEATRLLAQGDVKAALELYQQNGCIFLEKTDEEAIATLTRDWLGAATTPEQIPRLLVLAHRNVDVEQLNASIRDARIARGDIQAGHWVDTAQGKREISVGDRLLFLKNERRMGVSNGRFGMVTHIECLPNGNVASIHVQCDGMERPIVFNPAEYDSFTHGYAATVHKSQGVTVDRSFIFAGGRGWNRCLSYVAKTRHRLECRLYASQDNFESEEALFKSMGRAALKDSVLDFPLAFSERRGLDNTKGLNALPQRLHHTLKIAHEKITGRCEQFFVPQVWAQKQHKKLQLHEKALQDAARREDARLVAAYVDANRVVGEMYGNESNTPISKNMQRLLEKRNLLAFDILKEPARYEKAIDICALDLKKLSRQAKRHQCDETVKRYLACLAQKPLSRNQIAAMIYADIKGHYPSLKQWGVESRGLKVHALAHQQRVLLKSMSKSERADFRCVHSYHQFALAIGSVWARILSSQAPDNMQRREDVLVQQRMAIERDKLAHLILDNPTRFDKALDFFHIGMASPRFMDETPTPEAVQKAQQRWFKCQQYAGTHALRLRVSQYLDAIQQKEVDTQKRLAFEIVEDNKAHHALLLEHDIPIKDVWRNIRRDAKTYERDQLLNGVSPEQHSAFLLVEKYAQANRSHKNAWRELFESKAFQGGDLALNNLARFAATYTQQRNQLATQVLDNQKACEFWFEHFKIKPDELHPAATAHQAVIAVERYHRATAPWERAVCAAVLTDNPKVHHKAVLDLNLDWKTIYRHATPFKQKALFGQLSFEEKQLYRLIQHYKKTNRHAGRLMGQKARPSLQHPPIASAVQVRLNGLFAKRDAWASKIVRASKELSNESLSNLTQITRFTLDKCQRQANAHTARLQTVSGWQVCFNDVLNHLQPIQHALLQNKLLEGAHVQSAINAIHTAQQYQQQYFKGASFNTWENALTENDTSSTQLQKQLSSLALFKDNIEQALRVQKSALPAPQASPITSPTVCIFQSLDVAHIRRDLNARAQEVALHYLGTPKTRTGKALFYGRNQGSLKVTITGSKQGYWYDFDNHAPTGGDMLSLIHNSLSSKHFKETLEEATRFLGGASSYVKNPFEPVSKSKSTPRLIVDDKEKQTQQHIASILKRCTDISGTLAARYLQEHRGITLDPELHMPSFRFHPNLTHWINGQTYPALVVLARDEKSNVCGLQAIFLNPQTAQKASLNGNAKLSRGRIQPGALIQSGTPNSKIAFAEGVETALSVANACPDWRVYVTFGISNFHKTPLHTKARSIVLCADNDGINSGTAKGVERAANALAEQGFDVWVAQPQKPEHSDKWDFNDALKAGGVLQVQYDLAKADLVQKGLRLENISHELTETLASVKEAHPATTSIEPSPTQDTPLSQSETLPSLLRRFVEMEMELTRLVNLKIERFTKDLAISKEYLQRAIQHHQAITVVAKELVQHPLVKAELDALKKCPRTINTSGENRNILYDRFMQGVASPQDIQTLIKHVQSKSLTNAKTLHQSRDEHRGRTQ